MIPDIVIILLSLIAIFERKKWPIITATICLIPCIGLNLISTFVSSGAIDPNSFSEISGSAATLSNEVFDNSSSGKGKMDALVIIFFEILFFIIGWIRVSSAPKKKELPPQQTNDLKQN